MSHAWLISMGVLVILLQIPSALLGASLKAMSPSSPTATAWISDTFQGFPGHSADLRLCLVFWGALWKLLCQVRKVAEDVLKVNTCNTRNEGR